MYNALLNKVIIWPGQSRLKQEVVDRREGGPTALNIESSQNDVGELAYFQARGLYIMTHLHIAVMNIFFTLPIKYSRITNIYARFNSFLEKNPPRSISLVSR